MVKNESDSASTISGCLKEAGDPALHVAGDLSRLPPRGGQVRGGRVADLAICFECSVDLRLQVRVIQQAVGPVGEERRFLGPAEQEARGLVDRAQRRAKPQQLLAGEHPIPFAGGPGPGPGRALRSRGGRLPASRIALASLVSARRARASARSSSKSESSASQRIRPRGVRASRRSRSTTSGHSSRSRVFCETLNDTRSF